MKFKYSILLIVLLSLAGYQTKAQSFNNFQSIQKYSVFFSISWQKKVNLGVGYSFRLGGDVQFTDVQFEWRAPVDNFFSGNQYQVIAGANVRHSASRTVLASGYHLIYNKHNSQNSQANWLDLSLSVLPGRQYAAPLDDKPNGVFAARITYQPTIFANVDGEQSVLSAHTVKAGAHFDIIVKRALGIGINPVIANTFQTGSTVLPDRPAWDFEGDFYFTPTYFRNIR
ncbi:MAG: hypothetical protein AAF598_02030 [Bacteroidota bacterium]